MEVSRCAHCDTVLSRALRRISYPHRDIRPDGLTPRLAYGTYAIDPEPFVPLYGSCNGYPREREGATGPRGTYVLAPADVRNTRLIIERCEIGCLGLNGGAGPNMACASCGTPVATRIDDCRSWQETRLDPTAVVLEDGYKETDEPPGPFQWEAEEADRIGTAPADDWLWFGKLAACAAKILARSGGGPIFLAEGPGNLIREVLASSLKHTSLAGAACRLPSSRTTALAEWHVAAATADLDETAGRQVTICDLTSPDRPFGAPPDAWYERARLIGVVADSVPDTWQWSQDLPWARDLPASAVHSVPLDAGIWSYLIHDQSRTVRSLARTRFRHHDLAATVHRDEPPPPATDLAARPGYLVVDFLSCLEQQPESHQPWLRALIEELHSR